MTKTIKLKFIKSLFPYKKGEIVDFRLEKYSDLVKKYTEEVKTDKKAPKKAEKKTDDKVIEEKEKKSEIEAKWDEDFKKSNKAILKPKKTK